MSIPRKRRERYIVYDFRFVLALCFTTSSSSLRLNEHSSHVAAAVRSKSTCLRKETSLYLRFQIVARIYLRASLVCAHQRGVAFTSFLPLASAYLNSVLHCNCRNCRSSN